MLVRPQRSHLRDPQKATVFSGAQAGHICGSGGSPLRPRKGQHFRDDAPRPQAAQRKTRSEPTRDLDQSRAPGLGPETPLRTLSGLIEVSCGIMSGLCHVEMWPQVDHDKSRISRARQRRHSAHRGCSGPVTASAAGAGAAVLHQVPSSPWCGVPWAREPGCGACHDGRCDGGAVVTPTRLDDAGESRGRRRGRGRGPRMEREGEDTRSSSGRHGRPAAEGVDQVGRC